MHEMSLLNDLLARIDATARQAGSDRVTRVKVTLGAFSHISAAHFREHFEAGVRGTVAEGARLEIVENPDTEDPRAQEIVLDELDVED